MSPSATGRPTAQGGDVRQAAPDRDVDGSVRVDGSAHDGVEGRDVDVVILGSGFAGLGMGLQLASRGDVTFLVLERAGEVGGTWRDNRYPGVACDIPSHLYSFSFRPKADWSRVYATGAEIQDYLRDCAGEPGLAENIRLDTEVLDARWDEADALWRIRTTRGTCTANALVVGAGRLSEPRLPGVPMPAEGGPLVLHSARWPEGLDVTGLRVGVVGTGASAVQLVPEMARTAARTVVFQRSAPWILPREDRPYTAAEKRSFALDDGARLALREAVFAQAETGFPARRGDAAALASLRRRARDHLAAQVADPRLRDALTPRYEIGCKRVLFSDDYYPALSRGAVTLEPSAVARVETSGAVAVNGRCYPLDVVVLATGFLSTRPPFAHRVLGRGGTPLSEHWRHGMTSYASTVVHGYPNLFVINGPNASLGHNSSVHMIETQIGYVLGALDHLGPGRVLEVRAEAEQAYTEGIDRAARSTVWLTGGCTSWYRDEGSGRLTLLWPGTAESFRERNGVFDVAAFTRRRATAGAARGT